MDAPLEIRVLGELEVVRAGKRSIDLTFRGYITEGISDGSIKPCDAKLSAFAIAGSLNWIGHWYQSNGPLSPQAIAEEFTDRLTEGLARGRMRPAARSSFPSRACRA